MRYYQKGAGSLPPTQHDQYSHAHSHVALHNASLAELGSANQSTLPPGSIGIPPPAPHQQTHYVGSNLGSAVSSSMHLTNSSHDSDVSGAVSGYKMDSEMMYYSVSC